MQGPRGVEGKSFTELIPHEEDEDRLRSIINKPVATPASAGCLHFHMRDACGSSVLVQLVIKGSRYSHRAYFLSFLPAVVLWESTAAVGRSMAGLAFLPTPSGAFGP